MMRFILTFLDLNPELRTKLSFKNKDINLDLLEANKIITYMTRGLEPCSRLS